MNLEILYFFFKFPYDFHFLKNLLKSFFNSRGIICNIETIPLSNFVSRGLNFLFLDFLRSDFYITSKLYNQELKFYKLKLKLLLKISFNKQIILILNIVNIEIMKWLEYTFSLPNKEKLYYKLDLYVYRLFWRHLKKRHPKKSNTWIYLRYWGNFSGLWKFFIFDYKFNKLVFLKSHFSLVNNFIVNNYKVYNSLNIFNMYNVIKLKQIIFKKFQFKYLPNYIVLYEKQKGLCFSCTKALGSKNFRILYLKKNRDKLFQNLVIVHLYCSFKMYIKYI